MYSVVYMFQYARIGDNHFYERHVIDIIGVDRSKHAETFIQGNVGKK